MYLFLERGEGREKEGEKHQCVRETLISFATCMYPDWESNGNRTGDLLLGGMKLNQLSHAGQGYYNTIDDSPYVVLYIPMTVLLSTNLYYLIPSPFPPIPPQSPSHLATIKMLYESVSGLLVPVFCFVLFLDSTYKGNHMVFVFL